MSAASFAQIGISISFAPPELPVYEQPICPGDGYLWTPGYWAYANDYDDYYWVRGTWVMAPEVGLLWTPAYWGWGGNGYVFYDGYWGQQVGFYGGVSYGYGYYGNGYEGGRWDNGHFFYNRSVNNVNVTVIHNVYNTTVINSTVVNRVSYNGGSGGISVRPRATGSSGAGETYSGGSCTNRTCPGGAHEPGTACFHQLWQRRLLPLRSPEHSATALSCQPRRQELRITLP